MLAEVLKSGELYKANNSAKIDVEVNGVNIKAMIDSGASCNLIDRDTAKLTKL